MAITKYYVSAKLIDPSNQHVTQQKSFHYRWVEREQMVRDILELMLLGYQITTNVHYDKTGWLP